MHEKGCFVCSPRQPPAIPSRLFYHIATLSSSSSSSSSSSAIRRVVRGTEISNSRVRIAKTWEEVERWSKSLPRKESTEIPPGNSPRETLSLFPAHAVVNLTLRNRDGHQPLRSGCARTRETCVSSLARLARTPDLRHEDEGLDMVQPLRDTRGRLSRPVQLPKVSPIPPDVR